MPRTTALHHSSPVLSLTAHAPLHDGLTWNASSRRLLRRSRSGASSTRTSMHCVTERTIHTTEPGVRRH